MQVGAALASERRSAAQHTGCAPIGAASRVPNQPCVSVSDHPVSQFRSSRADDRPSVAPVAQVARAPDSDTHRASAGAAEPPLVVDLDGTLIRTDLLLETGLAALKLSPRALYEIALAARDGLASLKRAIATRVAIQPELLPYNAAFLAYLRAEHARGRRLVLATASDKRYADAIAAHLGLFSHVIGSDGETNVKADAKHTAIVAALGDSIYDYAGNSTDDLTLFARARRAILVDPDSGVETKARSLATIDAVFTSRTSPQRDVLNAIRPHQWLKNLLVFVPLVLAHKIFHGGALLQGLVAFVAFSLCASGVYLLNDLLDLNEDRRHQRKRSRPLASGDLPINLGILLVPAFFAAAFMLALALPWAFMGVLAAYLAATMAYTFFIKRTMLFDVVTLAGLYTIRIIAGSAALAIPLSFWLLAFSMFLFFSLALVKRYVEVAAQAPGVTRAESGRAYVTEDKETLSQLGIGSGLMAVMVMALYVDSNVSKTLYRHPEVIWLACPLALYLVSRVWMLARRDHMHDDPVVWIIRDWRSQIVLAAIGMLLLVATL